MVAHKYQLPMSVLLQRLAIYAFGSIMLRSAACVWNDICDIDIDRAVGELMYDIKRKPSVIIRNTQERTRTRPLASGALSTTGAYIFLAFLTIGCVGLLAFADGSAYVS